MKDRGGSDILPLEIIVGVRGARDIKGPTFVVWTMVTLTIYLGQSYMDTLIPTSLLVFSWEYLRSPAKNLSFFAGYLRLAMLYTTLSHHKRMQKNVNGEFIAISGACIVRCSIKNRNLTIKIGDSKRWSRRVGSCHQYLSLGLMIIELIHGVNQQTQLRSATLLGGEPTEHGGVWPWRIYGELCGSSTDWGMGALGIEFIFCHFQDGHIQTDQWNDMKWTYHPVIKHHNGKSSTCGWISHVVRGFPMARCLRWAREVWPWWIPFFWIGQSGFFLQETTVFPIKDEGVPPILPLNSVELWRFQRLRQFFIDSNQPMKLGKIVQAPCYCYLSGAMLCVDPQAEAMGGLPSQRVDDL